MQTVCHGMWWTYSAYMYHVYKRMPWFVVIKFGRGGGGREGVGAKLNRLRLETNYELMILEL